MFRPVFLFKILIISLALNSVFILHLLLQTTRHQLPDSDTINARNDDNRYDSVYVNNPTSTDIKIIPMPIFVTRHHAKLLLSNHFQIVPTHTPSKYLQSALLRYSKYFALLTGISTKVEQNISPSQNTLIIDCSSIKSRQDKYPELGEDESYTITVTTEGSRIAASTVTGIIRGLSTFVQLIERDPASDKIYIPFVTISDRPRFAWRGLLLDVSRHWMPVSVVKRTLNAMELSKMNVLHLHLSDDQGFRVESLEYRLLHDRKDFFTQKDIRHVIEYAAERRIRIVPEFDIPGHTTSWFVGYPELATRPDQYVVESRWGMMKPTMDPTRESTYTFLDKFFREMTALFPDPYFHIGGDEVEGTHWMEKPSIQTFINEQKLGNKNGLQAYFNQRIQKMLKKYGKIMIGWEEILDEISPNLAVEKDAVIQSWKNRKSLASAISKGYRGLLSTGYYLDHLASSTFHYNTDPILNDELWLFNDQERSHILGGEACMWSEYASQDTIDSRIWPRVLAIAERFWSSSYQNHSHSLYERLFRMNHLLDKTKTGVTHLSLYKLRLQNLIPDTNQKTDLLHPFIILADVSEPYGFEPRAQSGKYSANISLTTFIDALQSESELIWKLENHPINDKKFRDVFRTWSLNHFRLRELFDEIDKTSNRQLWGQDVEQLSKNLAQVGQIGLGVLDYFAKEKLPADKNNTFSNWPLSIWISQQSQLLDQLENQVYEVRLAAVRPVRRLLNSMKIFV